MTWKRAIIVGATSGIGEEIVRQLSAQGTQCAALGRREDRLDQLAREIPNLVVRTHDVLQTNTVPDLFAELCRELGGLDLLIYNAGLLTEPAEWEDDQRMMEVNLVGAIPWLRLAADRFEGVGAGTIVGIGSVAGDRARAGRPGYSASKAGLHAYLESLRNRLSRRGVVVSTIKPGPVDTEMTRHLSMNKMPVQTAVQILLKKASKPGEHYLSPVHAAVFTILRAIPSPIFRRLPLE